MGMASMNLPPLRSRHIPLQKKLMKNQLKLQATTISKTVILPIQVEEKHKEEVVIAASSSSSSTISIREVWQVEELVLESVYQKPATHEFFFPNCQSCIHKVFFATGKLD
ncbi:hypothetical protein LINPERPRIM_LOCUS20634 [Linum perenne]